MTAADAVDSATTVRSDATWVEDNQRYLTAAMDVLRRRLRKEEVGAALEPVKARFSFATADDREKFFGWFEDWFLKRATPPPRAPAA